MMALRDRSLIKSCPADEPITPIIRNFKLDADLFLPTAFCEPNAFRLQNVTSAPII
jgi:hypothetical protein